MITIFILVSIVLATALLSAVLIGVVLFVLTASEFPSGSDGCDFCPSDSASSLGGGHAACDSCASKRL